MFFNGCQNDSQWLCEAPPPRYRALSSVITSLICSCFRYFDGHTESQSVFIKSEGFNTFPRTNTRHMQTVKWQGLLSDNIQEHGRNKKFGNTWELANEHPPAGRVEKNSAGWLYLNADSTNNPQLYSLLPNIYSRPSVHRYRWRKANSKDPSRNLDIEKGVKAFTHTKYNSARPKFNTYFRRAAGAASQHHP